jgi:hypothetical protein
LSLTAYLELSIGQRPRLLASGRPLAHQGTVDTTVMLTVDRLPKAAVQLLQVCAARPRRAAALPIDLFSDASP